jgi:hypothetical protein
VWNFRGTKNTDLENFDDKSAVKASFLDWFETNLDATPAPDKLCHNPSVEIFGGFLQAYLELKTKMVKDVTESFNKFTARGDKPVKIFIVGHSLGCAMSNVAIYDIFCNKLFGKDVDYDKQVFNIGYGSPILWYGDKSIRAYQDMVPVQNRLRILTCAHFDNPKRLDKTDSFPWVKLNTRSGYSCDIVGTGFPHQFYEHPDDDFQASFQPDWIVGNGYISLTYPYRGNCFGRIRGVHCHQLQRYLVGLTDAKFDKFCGPQTVYAGH